MLHLLLVSVALANDPDPLPTPEVSEVPPAAEAAPETATPLSPTEVSEAETLPTVDTPTLRFLAPKRWRLPGNARGQTDFTAYTLEWGEVRLGLAAFSLGILPRTQLGTLPVLDALGVWNGQLKVDLLRAGPLDLAAGAQIYRFSGKTMGANYLSAGGTASLTITTGWSIHGGAEWASFSAAGTPNLDPLVPLLDRFVGFVPSDEFLTSAEDQLQFEANGEAVVARAATDLRINRRDSFILQGEAMIWGKVDLPIAIPAALTGGAPLQNAQGMVPIADAYTASVAYQLAMKHLELRIGVGISSVPGAWILQSTELAWRFGGPTRAAEHRMLRSWRQNKRDMKQAQSAPTELPEG